ncbi:MAG: hypothetical protein SFU98_17475 [Leptospiraceae bacterium]|nr:hypothetical protein [Leptospiraceae bacterium]
MENAIILKGTILDPKHILLFEPLLEGMKGEVEIVVRVLHDIKTEDNEKFFQYVTALPPGQKSKQEIDFIIQSERTSW